MSQPQIRIIGATNDTATLPTIQFGGSEQNGSGVGIRGNYTSMIHSVGTSDVSTITATTIASTASVLSLAGGTVKPFATLTSAAGAGGGATEAMTITGLLSTDTIVAVTQKTKGANNLPLLGYTTLANGALTCVWSADPGAGAVIVVTVSR